IQIDLAMLGFAFLLCVAVGLVIAVVPFVHALGRRDPAQALRQGNSGASSSKGEQRVRAVLVAAQVAIACVMLVGAGLLGRSLVALERVDAGIDVRNVVTARLSLNFTKYNTPELRRQAGSALLDHLTGLPGTSAAALASALPLGPGRPSD